MLVDNRSEGNEASLAVHTLGHFVEAQCTGKRRLGRIEKGIGASQRGHSRMVMSKPQGERYDVGQTSGEGLSPKQGVIQVYKFDISAMLAP